MSATLTTTTGSGANGAASLPIFSSIDAAVAACPVGSTIVSESWRAVPAKGTPSKDRHVCIPSIYLSGTAAGSFAPLVQAVLTKTAASQLKGWINADPEATEIPEYLFHQSTLVEAATGSVFSDWPSESDWDELFTSSATWARIATRPEFSSNPIYRRKAETFKGLMLKLQGKRAKIDPETAEVLLSKLADEDSGTRFGVFAMRRLEAMMQQSRVIDDLSGLP